MKDVPPTRIRFLAELRNGFPFASGTFTNEPLTPLIRIRDIKSTSFNTFVPRWAIPDEAIAKDGDIIIGMDGDFNSILWTRGEAAINQRVASLRPTKGTDSRFIAYAIPRKLKEINDITHSTTVKHISGEQILNIQVPHYDLPTQRRIADYLDRETAQIDAMAGALDGLVARLEERRENLRDIEYRRASMSHKTPRLRVICESIIDGPFGSSLTSAHYTESGVRVIRLGNIGVNKFKDSDKAFISETHGNTLSNHDALPGDVIIAGLGDLNNPVGRACVVPEDVGRSIVKADCYRVRPGKTVNPSFLAHMLNAPQVREVSRRSSRGSTRIRLTTGIAANSRIPLPPLDEQRRIADHLDAETAKIDAMIAKAGELRALLDERRSALITATVTGQHPVPEEP